MSTNISRSNSAVAGQSGQSNPSSTSYRQFFEQDTREQGFEPSYMKEACPPHLSDTKAGSLLFGTKSQYEHKKRPSGFTFSRAPSYSASPIPSITKNYSNPSLNRTPTTETPMEIPTKFAGDIFPPSLEKDQCVISGDASSI